MITDYWQHPMQDPLPYSRQCKRYAVDGRVGSTTTQLYELSVAGSAPLGRELGGGHIVGLDPRG